MIIINSHLLFQKAEVTYKALETLLKMSQQQYSAVAGDSGEIVGNLR